MREPSLVMLSSEQIFTKSFGIRANTGSCGGIFNEFHANKYWWDENPDDSLEWFHNFIILY
jgi:hypothetical protein